MDIIPQIIVSGLAAGGVYGLIALGFVLIYKATSILNLATGEFMTLGAFICFSVMTQISAPFSVAFLVTLGFASLLGIVVERVVLRPLIGEPIIAVIMVTIGLASILKGLTHMIWSPQYRSFPPIFPPQPLDLGFAIVTLRFDVGIHFRSPVHRNLHGGIPIHTHRLGHESYGR